ncbi:hypothetical protein [Microtetraspora malaysiensis]|uniref:Uncharacterized protein n=1 Tax=Microtetraspora malaysiensis TaxID=161358 RepID=A0ABW6T8M9_9ACTN
MKVVVARPETVEGVNSSAWIFAERVMFTKRELRTLNNLPDSEEWLRARGAVHPDVAAIKLVLRGDRGKRVRITGMRALSTCTAPLTGTYMYVPDAGANDVIGVGLNLDRPNPRAQIIEVDNNGLADHPMRMIGDYFATKTVSLKQDEEVVFQVLAQTTKHYCEFRLEVTVVDGDNEVRQVIDDYDQPFRVSADLRLEEEAYTGIPHAYDVAYVGGVFTNAGWVRVKPR